MDPIRPYNLIITNRRHNLVTIAWLVLLFIIGCGGGATVSRDKTEWTPPKKLPPMHHSIQVGAFSDINNAVRFTKKLHTKGLNAYHFRHDSGLYKVRFGNYASKNFARKKAENLKTVGMIEEYYIVGPKDYAALSYQSGDNDYLRSEIVRTAKQYIGVPYKWGGESPKTGFDCSGLTMVAYQLNGLDLRDHRGNSGKPAGRSTAVNWPEATLFSSRLPVVKGYPTWAFTPATASSCMRPAEAGTFRYRLCQTPIINPVIWAPGRTCREIEGKKLRRLAGEKSRWGEDGKIQK